MAASLSAVVGIAWYRQDRYDAIVGLMTDGASFPKTHASWRHKAGRMEREIERQGQRPIRIELDPEVFSRWCESRGRRPDSVSRTAFVDEAIAGLHAAPA